MQERGIMQITNFTTLVLLSFFIVESFISVYSVSEVLGHEESRRWLPSIPEVPDQYSQSQAAYKRMRKDLLALKYFVGRKGPQIDIRHFINWDRTIEVDNLFYTCPRTLWEAVRVIRAAAWLHLRVRATGIGHTRSPLYADEGQIMMDNRCIERHDGPRMEFHPPTWYRKQPSVTVMSGVYEYELNQFLIDNGVTMVAQPVTNNQTVGGMVAVSTHGSTLNSQTYSGYVAGMRVIDSYGRLRIFSETHHRRAMKALACNLGMFGFMYDITLKVFPMAFARVTNTFMDIDSIIYNRAQLKRLVTGSFATDLSWYPFNSVTDQEADHYQKTGIVPQSWTAGRDQVWVRTINIVDSVDAQQLQGPMFLPTRGAVSGGNATGLLKARDSLSIARELPHVSYHYLVDAFPYIRPPRFGSETSLAFMLNIDNQFQRPAEALQFLVEETENQIKREASTPANVVLPRFLRNSDCLLCPGNTNIRQPDDSGSSLVVDFLALPTQQGFYEMAERFIHRFRSQKIRPHWPKRHSNLANLTDIIKEVYGDNISEFMRIRKMLKIDPCDMFMNNYLVSIFGHTESAKYRSVFC